MSILKHLLEADKKSAWEDQKPKPLDIEAFLEPALEEVVETIMMFGEYPQPPTRRSIHRPPKEFDLYDFLKDELDQSELLEYYIGSITDHTRYKRSSYETFSTVRNVEIKRVDELLTAHLKGSDIVRDRAEELAKDAENE